MPVREHNFTSTLHANAQQRVAIQHQDGPLLIIAGPGSGKTFTLVERIIYLLQQGITAGKIMVSTFTEKAAAELITRISNRSLELGIKANLNEMYVGTLHSIFLRILEDYREYTRLKRSYRILDQFDQQYLIYSNLNTFEALDGFELLVSERLSRWRKAGAIMGLVNKVSEEYLDIGVLQQAEEPEVQALSRQLMTYEQLLEEENAIDFSFIQVETMRLLETQPEVAYELQLKLKYIMVDEYQDTNTIQEQILLMLASRHQNLCVVGDDDQGLYRFRGATIRNILEFADNFPKGTCKQVTLSTNYRSHPDIVQFYNEWMGRCDWSKDGKRFRYEKTIRPHEGRYSDVPAVLKLGAEGSEENYHEEVYRFISSLQASGTLTDLNQLAFLFRSVKNQKVIRLAHYLEERGISVFSPRSALFFEREEVRLLIGALVFIFPDLFQRLKFSDKVFLNVWEYYDDCKREFAEALRAQPEKNQGLLQWARQKAKAHLTLTGKTTYAFAALVYQMLEYPMFADYLHNDLKGEASTQRAAYNIAMITKLLHKFEYLDNVSVITASNIDYVLNSLFNKFLRFMIEGGIAEYEDFDEYAPSGCVSFLTIHQSKGLEFPIVVVGSMNSVPRKQYKELDEILQSRYFHKPPFEPLPNTKNYDFWRLYYTAFSRAQNLLLLTANEQYEGRGRTPSKYLLPIYKPLPRWDEETVNLAEVPLEAVKAVNVKKEYAFTSHILLYENCPLKYKFYKELEFAEVRSGGMIGGTLLHQTIEDIHKAVLRDEAQHVERDELVETWFNHNYFLLVKQQRGYLSPAQLRSLLKQVLRYRDRMRGQWHIIQEAEVDVSLVKESYILKGTIDLIRGEEGTVEIIDFKSGDKPDVNDLTEYNRRALRGFQRQLEIYAHIIEERTEHQVSKMHLYYTKEEAGSPYITFRNQPERIGNTIQAFDEVVHKIEHKDFDISHITKSEKQCGNCDMRYYCNPRTYK
jgi:DNA helicase-2/ATP-dependent DNA helicase PcrA